MKTKTKNIYQVANLPLWGLLLILFLSNNLYTQKLDFKKLKTDVSELSKNTKTINVNKIKEIKIHDSGRIKPLDTYAKTMLLIINGKSTFLNEEAITWLARVMWKPETTVDDKVFKIVFDEVLISLGIRPDKGRRYSYNQLFRSFKTLSQLSSLGYSKTEGERTSGDKEFIRVYENFVLYSRMMNSFLFSLPVQNFYINSKEVRKELNLGDENYFSYINIMEISSQLKAKVSQINQKKASSLSGRDSLLIELSQNYDNFLKNFEQLPFAMFPSYTHGEKWFSLWDIFKISSGKNIVKGEIKLLDEIVNAYSKKDQEEFDEKVEQFIIAIDNKTENSSVNFKIKAELFYNLIDPFYRAEILLGFGFVLIILSFIIWPKILRKISWYVFLIGLGLTIFGIINRALITFRPPITNLFETFIFVAAITGILSIFIEKFNKNGLGILTGCLSTLLLLLISNSFTTNGDTMGVLIAVLRSNFWLSTHVVVINLGYAGIILSGVVGHIYLFQTLKKKANPIKLKSTYRVIYAIQAFGLIFSLIGTVLGGIWADQSWGRFWGWDPKENGALLIVLWSAIIFHSRFAGIILDLGYAVGSILGIIVVMIAWFGINLLGVGLHSYGFIAGIAYTLYSYIAAQFIFIIVILTLIEYRKQNKQMKN